MIIILVGKVFHRVGEVREPDYEVNLCVGIVNHKVAKINRKAGKAEIEVGKAEEVVVAIAGDWYQLWVIPFLFKRFIENT